jgi:hypothetical protein
MSHLLRFPEQVAGSGPSSAVQAMTDLLRSQTLHKVQLVRSLREVCLKCMWQALKRSTCHDFEGQKRASSLLTSVSDREKEKGV